MERGPTGEEVTSPLISWMEVVINQMKGILGYLHCLHSTHRVGNQSLIDIVARIQ